MWLMLQQRRAGRLRGRDRRDAHASASSCELAFGLVGLDWQDYVEIDARYFRPTEVDELCGDASKATRASSAGEPTTTFEELVRIMLAADLARGRPRSGRVPAAPLRIARA